MRKASWLGLVGLCLGLLLLAGCGGTQPKATAPAELNVSAAVSMKDALEEIQQYRTIGTVEECRAAMEKQTAKKPKKTESEGYRYTDTYRCPNCGGNFSGTGIADYCYHCGQKLDWGDEE